MAEMATPPPLASTFTKVAAVRSRKTTITYMSVSQMNVRNSLYARGEMYCLASSATERALWRTDAIVAPKSCTPPTRIVPATIQISAGSQPKKSPARIGPTIGPAPAMDAK